MKNDFVNVDSLPSFEKAGPREKLTFKPGETVSAIVTCGGLCPGLNAVVRSLVMMNWHRYGNKKNLMELDLVTMVCLCKIK